MLSTFELVAALALGISPAVGLILDTPSQQIHPLSQVLLTFQGQPGDK
jgi:hypothetical protein